jgi:hypothetical protein
MTGVRTGDLRPAIRASLEQAFAVVGAVRFATRGGNGPIAFRTQPVRDGRWFADRFHRCLLFLKVSLREGRFDAGFFSSRLRR